MIHVTIFQNKYKECVGFQTEGHAEYADPGQDIVCAAASVLIINTMNAIELYTEDDLHEAKAEVEQRYFQPDFNE